MVSELFSPGICWNGLRVNRWALSPRLADVLVGREALRVLMRFAKLSR
jgi:hypothetical protein